MGRRFTVVTVIFLLLFISSTAFAGYTMKVAKVTRNHQLFDGETFDAKIIWHATFFSNNFRKAYDERHIKINYLDEAAAGEYIRESELRQSQGWDFFISFYTKKDYKKFSIEPDSFWKIYLVTESSEKVAATDIEAVPITPYIKQMYPRLNRWSKAYRVTFPKVDLGDDKFELTIESVVGKSTLAWKASQIKKAKSKFGSPTLGDFFKP